jgi:glycosyltransferase involved in cell wall biosynthesis
MEPIISVIMSVYNGEKYLRASIESILNQTLTEFEFIIINDGSTDKTKDILKYFSDGRIIVIEQQNCGLTISLNKAISISRGKYIARQDADDISMPSRLEKQKYFLENNKDMIMVGSTYCIINEENEEKGIYKLPISDTEIRWNMIFRNPFCHSTIMIHSDIMKKENLCYDNKLYHSQDYDLWSRIIKFGKVQNIEEPLIKLRFHSNQIGKTYTNEQQSTAENISKMNMKNLGIDVSDGETKKLRRWSFQTSIELNKEEMNACKLLINILRTFEKKENIDYSVFKRIRKDIIIKICDAINFENYKYVMSSFLFFDILKSKGGIIFLRNMYQRAYKKIYRNNKNLITSG